MSDAPPSDWLCDPVGIFSWDFNVTGNENRAHIQLKPLSEQGEIVVDGQRFRVRKESWVKGHWALLQDADVIAEAKKTSPLTQTVKIIVGNQDLLLDSDTIFGRSFTLRKDGIRIASFRPTHWWSRRTFIRTHQDDTPFVLCCFTFWIVATLWRRAANSG